MTLAATSAPLVVARALGDEAGINLLPLSSQLLAGKKARVPWLCPGIPVCLPDAKLLFTLLGDMPVYPLLDFA